MISCLMINEKETNIIWSLKRGASIVANTLPPLGYWEVSAILHLARALRKRRPDVLSFKEEFRVIRFNVDSLDWKKMSESKRRGKVPRDAEGERLACARANFSVGIPTWDYRHLLHHPLQSPFILSKGGTGQSLGTNISEATFVYFKSLQTRRVGSTYLITLFRSVV